MEISSSILTETQFINTILEGDSHPISTLGSKHVHLEKLMEKAQADKEGNITGKATPQPTPAAFTPLCNSGWHSGTNDSFLYRD